LNGSGKSQTGVVALHLGEDQFSGVKEFFKSLDIVDKRLMGLYDDTWLGFLPGLEISIISATFNCLGQ
jgi:hypothetical protein